MARGIRSNVSLLPVFSPAQQPQSLSSYDAKTRRNTILIAEIVPTIALMDSASTVTIPADRYYAILGAADSSTFLPRWLTTGPTTYNQWDATEKRFYATGAFGINGQVRMVYPTGPFGQTTSYAPKNAGAVACLIKFRARFPDNADYTTNGIGASATNVFNNAAIPFIQVLRNSGAWELGTADGSTLSQVSGGTADSSWHDFKVRWASGEITLYVDDVLTITKTTNLPNEPLGANATMGANNVDTIDYLVEWEVG